MYVQPLSVGQPSGMSTIETPSEQSIQYVAVLVEQPCEPMRKYERLVEVVTTKTKRVEQKATRQRKIQKSLMIIMESNKEEEEVKKEEKIIVSKQIVGKARQPWKPNIEKINSTTANEGNFFR